MTPRMWIEGGTAAILSILLLLAVRAVPGATQAQAAAWQVAGQIGGPTQAVAVQGNYAYVGVGLRLVVLDVSNPASLREVGATRPFPHFVEGVAVSGTLAYVADAFKGLRVVDVSDPTGPVEVGSYEVSGGHAGRVVLAGGVAHVADRNLGLQVVSVLDSRQPASLSAYAPLSNAWDVSVSGRYARAAAAEPAWHGRGPRRLLRALPDPG